MAINDIVQTIAEARVDARSLSEFVFKPADFTVTRRLAPSVRTLQYYIDIFDNLDVVLSSSVIAAQKSLNSSVAEAQGKVAYIESTVQDAINNTAVEGGVLADTFLTVTKSGIGTVPRNQSSKNSDVVTPYDFGVKGGFNEETLASRFDTLSSAQAQYPNAVALTEYADRVAFDAFLLHLINNNVSNVSWTCDIAIEKPLVSIRESKTTAVSGSLGVIAVANMEYALHIATVGFIITDQVSFSSNVPIWTDMRSRHLNHGLVLGTYGSLTGESHSCIIGAVYSNNIRGFGVIIGDNSHFVNINRINAVNSGSGKKHSTIPFLQGVSSVIESTSLTGADIGQRSVIKVKAIPLPASEKDTLLSSIAVINNNAYFVMSIDYSSNTVELYPHIPRDQLDSISDKSLTYHYGGGLLSVGSNSAVTTVHTIRTITSGIGYRFTGLYGTKIGTLVSEHNGLGLAVGSWLSANHGCTIGMGYFEHNNYDAVLGWLKASETQPVAITNSIGLDLSKSKMMAGYTRANGDQRPDWSITQNVFTQNGKMYQPLIGNILDIVEPHTNKLLYGVNHTLVFNRDLSRLAGIRSKTVYLVDKAEITLTLPQGMTFKTNKANSIIIDTRKYNSEIVPIVFSWAGSSATEEIDIKVLSGEEITSVGHTVMNENVDINNISKMNGTVYAWIDLQTRWFDYTSLTGVWSQLPKSAMNGMLNSGTISTKRLTPLEGGNKTYIQTVEIFETGESWSRLWTGETGSFRAWVYKQTNIPVRNTTPQKPFASVQYIDSSVTPNQLKTYTGSAWV